MMKGKRTKRPRPLLSSEEGGSSGGSTDNSAISEAECGGVTTVEEEDMARCLILLAQGTNSKTNNNGGNSYECKTCNRSFLSFQALGGHRTSHKNPKLNEPKKSPFMLCNLDDQLSDENKAKVHECSICGADFSSGQALGGHMRRHRPIGTTSSKNPNPSSLQDCKKEEDKTKNVLSLDLNLPAPEDDHHCRDSKFVFSSNENTLVFSASSLVDCHY